MKKSIMAFMASLLLFTSFAPAYAEEPTYPFVDVDLQTEGYVAIQRLWDEGIVVGYTGRYYRPKEEINRAEFLKIVLYTAFHFDQNEANKVQIGTQFSDLKKEDWFAGYVQEAYNRGLITGYPDKTFKPGNHITFAEASKILNTTFDLPYDKLNDGEWFQKYVDELRRQNAIPESIKANDQMLSRAQMAMIIFKLKYENPQGI